MFKCAFILNSRSLSPETYSAEYKNEEFHFYMAAVHGLKMTCELAEQLGDEDFNCLDLCGFYDEKMEARVQEAAGANLKVSHAKYTKEQQEKFNQLESQKEFGLIIMAKGTENKPQRIEMESLEINTHIALVNSEEMAVKVAREMIQHGIDFIELCSYFDAEKAEAFIEGIGRQVPVGYCG
ncbi:MAG: DUF6506 family protein [Anaerovoracaceae bacterium]|jgi:hypothetical protein